MVLDTYTELLRDFYPESACEHDQLVLRLRLGPALPFRIRLPLGRCCPFAFWLLCVLCALLGLGRGLMLCLVVCVGLRLLFRVLFTFCLLFRACVLRPRYTFRLGPFFRLRRRSQYSGLIQTVMRSYHPWSLAVFPITDAFALVPL